ncbi:hypothetical protein DMUE_2470 [Dictyocoela muelleri]|nr:hypothetical protein DMUE_2470 [Dictyocoela muelleri]
MFEYRSEASGLKITYKIIRLSSYEDQDLLNWYISFKETARICNWNEAVQYEVLRQIVDINIQLLIGERNNVGEILHGLLKLKYNENTSHIYQDELHSIKQSNFMTTRAYIKKIEITTRKLATCLNWSDHITNLKIQETFFAGLDEATKIEITRYTDRTYTKIVEKFINLETLLISKFNREYNELNKNLNKSEEQHYFERERCKRHINDNNSNRHKTHTATRTQKKYCRYHKSTTHSDSECRLKNKKQDHKNDEKTFAIKETPIIPKTIEVYIKISDYNYKALIDTGSV